MFAADPVSCERPWLEVAHGSRVVATSDTPTSRRATREDTRTTDEVDTMGGPSKATSGHRGEDRAVEVPLPRGRTSDGRPLRITSVANPAPRASLGFLGGAIRVAAKPAFRYAVLEIPIDPEAIRAGRLEGESLRIFRWDEDVSGFRLLPASSVDPTWRRVSSPITEPGLYAVIGLSADPWVRTTLEVFDLLEPIMRSPELREPMRATICGLILCPPPELGEVMADPGLLAGFGLPPMPPGGPDTLCDLCLGLDLDPFGVPPEIQILERPHKPAWWHPRPIEPCADWLARNPVVANAIVWRDAGVPRAYPTWTAAEKTELCTAVSQIRVGSWAGLPAAPPASLILFGTGELFGTELDQATAWRYYIGYVAQSIAAELEGWLGWSLAACGAVDLELLFDSHSLFEWGSGPQKYGVLRDHGILFRHGAAMPGDPVRTFDFLRSGAMIGATPRDTIERVLEWCRTNLTHYYGGDDPANLDATWQYQGWPPVERIISGTTHPQNGFAHWTAGCWGTVGFLRTVLRTANIPVLLERQCDHALPHFVHEGLFLSHGDDPYSWLTKGNPPPYPAGQLLIDQATFDSWFGPTVSAATVCADVGRRTLDLALQYLPNYVLRAHCDDMAAGRPPAQSHVLDMFSGTYSLAELLTRNLWTLLDARIAMLGGCANVPPP